MLEIPPGLTVYKEETYSCKHACEAFSEMCSWKPEPVMGWASGSWEPEG